MKNLLLIPVLFFISCTSKTETSDDRIEITPLIRNAIVLRDTTLVRDVYNNVKDLDSGRVPMMSYSYMSGVTPRTFLNEEDFYQLCKGIKYLVANPESKVYFDPEAEAVSKELLRDKMMRCDSILEAIYDSKGNETITRNFRCDSISVYYNINRIVFYESWYFNKKSKMLDREVLGYSLQKYISERKAFMELFMVFNDEKAKDKVRRYYPY